MGLLKQLYIARCRRIMSGDTDVNPGPGRNFWQSQSFWICHWNLNRQIAHSFAKVSLLKVCLSVNKVDIVCLSVTYLNSKFVTDYDNMQISGYSNARVDHPTNVKLLLESTFHN